VGEVCDHAPLPAGGENFHVYNGPAFAVLDYGQVVVGLRQSLKGWSPMNKRAVRVAILMVLCAGLLLPGTLWANGLFYSFEGQSLVLESYDVAADGSCNQVLVYFSENVMYLKPGHEPSVYSGLVFEIVRGMLNYDPEVGSFCDPQEVDVYGAVSLTPDQFYIHPGLRFGTIKATVPGFDWSSNSQVAVNLDLRWTEAGPQEIDNLFFKTRGAERSLQVNQYHLVGRPAQVSGVIAIGSETFAIAEDALQVLASARSRTVFVLLHQP
jgi:hypothetical protein